jgi:hypothetical protein
MVAAVAGTWSAPKTKAWIVTVDMGLGHQRATMPLAALAEGGVLAAGDAGVADAKELKTWRNLLRSYEFISRTRNVPIFGQLLFQLLDSLQYIAPYYPKKDRSASTYQVRLLATSVRAGVGRGMVARIRTKQLPLVTAHPYTEIAADIAGYTPTYCMVTDSEISRAWVASDPKKSQIHYLAPSMRAWMRLTNYGVPAERVFLTGFPLPHENVGGPDLHVLKADVARRLAVLDPEKRFASRFGGHVKQLTGVDLAEAKASRPLTITYAVGGAGAQKEIGAALLESFRPMLQKGEVRLNLVANVRKEVKTYFEQQVARFAPGCPHVRVLYTETKEEYFRQFNEMLRETDVVWTKPSEMSFYCALGLPIVMAPPIGCQEQYNRRWLSELHAGIDQDEPRAAHEWLVDLWREGRLAEAAWDGFLKAPKHGTYNIMKILEAGLTDATKFAPLDTLG